MSAPVVSLDDFATYLNDDSVSSTDAVRAQYVLDHAQMLCESIVSPLPAGADVVVMDVAVRAYANPVAVGSAGQGLYAEGEGPYSDQTPGFSGGGFYLTPDNKQTLRNLAGRSGGAFSIDTTPATAGQNLPWWDTGIVPGW